MTQFQARQIAAGKAKALVLGNYLIADKIGAGGMGQVFKAEHRRMKRLVAIKMLPPAMVKDAAAMARFQREVEAAAKLTHPNIVAAYDADEANGVHFLVMEYVEGHDLSALVKKNGPMSVANATNYILQAAQGLAFAHSEGVVHRDIKPANLLLDKKGVVKILDMGLARVDGLGGVAQAELTTTGAVMGTVDYMAPEQALNTKYADQRADIYSLGITLFYLITGRAAYGGDSIMEKLLAHREQPIPSLKELQPTVSDRLEAIYMTMVAKKADDRYQSINEVVLALEAIAPRSSTSSITADAAFTWSPSADDRARLAKQPAPKSATHGLKGLTKTVAAEKTKYFFTKIIGGSFATIIAPIMVFYVIKHLDKDPVPPGPAPAATTTTSISSAAGQPLPSTPTVRTAAASPPAVANFALDFDAKAESQVAIPDWYHRGGIPLTVEAWVMPGATPRETQRSGIVANMQAEGGFRLALNSDWTYAFSLRGTNAEHSIRSDQPADRNRLSHVAAVFDGNDIRFYVDGQLQQRPQIMGLPLRDSSALTMIGKGPGTFFDGTIDEVRISTVARYTSDFTPPARFEPDKDTEVLYHFDEGRGTIAKDASVHHRDGETSGAIWTSVSSAPQPASTPIAAGPIAKSAPTAGAFDSSSQVQLLTSPNYVWSEPENLGPTINTNGTEGSPAISGDGLTLVYHSARPGLGSYDLWIAERNTINEPFKAPRNLGPDVNSTNNDNGAWLSADGLTLIFSSDRGDSKKYFHLYQSTRRSHDAPFGPVVPLAALNSTNQDIAAALSGDGRMAVIASGRSGGLGSHDLWQATRAHTSADFGIPALLGPPVNTAMTEGSPWLSADGRVLLFTRKSASSANDGEMWMAVRPSPTEAFAEPTLVGPPISIPKHHEGSVSVTADGRLMFFASSRPGSVGGHDIWMSRRVPKSRRASN